MYIHIYIYIYTYTYIEMDGSPNERRNYIFTAVLWGSAAMDEAED